MKKRISKFMVLLCVFAMETVAYAGIPTHPNYIALETPNLATKYASWTPGSAYPDATVSGDENFYISRVKFRKRFTNAATQVNPDLSAERKLLWWCPIGEGGNWTSHPNYEFDYDSYSSWSYTDIYGNWTQGFLRQPGSFADVCHKNGVASAVVSQPAFGANLATNGAGAIYQALMGGVTQNPSDDAAKKLLKLMHYYGIDGLGFNSECSFTGYIGLKSLFAKMHKFKGDYGMDQLHFDWYDGVRNAGSGPAFGSNQLDGTNNEWYFDGTNPVCNGFFLNYNWGNSELFNSQNYAKNTLHTTSYNVYAGMDLQGRTGNFSYNSKGADWKSLANHEISIGIWGAHATNMLYLGRGELGGAPKTSQETYLQRQEYFFTGGTKNPVSSPAIINYLSQGDAGSGRNFHGISKLMPAKSSLSWIQNGYFPFVTYFNMGNGQKLYREGQATFPNGWYNIGMQDYLPTWRWWITTSFMGRTAASVPEGVSATFTWDDAWNGGSCLKVTTTAVSNFFLHLFKTQFPLTSGATYKLKIRYKVTNGTAKGFAWALSNEGSEGTAVNNTIASNLTASNQWVEKEVNLNSISGKTLAMMALRFVNTSADFEILIGEVSLMKEGVTYTPSTPVIANSSNLKSYYNGVDFKLIWNCAAKATGGGTQTVTSISLGAQRTTTPTAGNYVIQSLGRSSYIYDNNTTGTQSDIKVKSAADLDCRFALEATTGGFYLKSISTGQYAQKPAAVGSGTPNANNYFKLGTIANADIFTIVNGANANTFMLRSSIGTGYLNTQIPDQGLVCWSGTGDWSQWKFYSYTENYGAATGNAWDPIYNEDCDISHFNVWFKQGADGEEKLCTQTTSWAAYVVGAPSDFKTGTPRDVYFGVSAVSLDGKSESPIQWTDANTVTTITPIDDIEIDKTVIKPNEDFNIKFSDFLHQTATWTIYDAKTGIAVAGKTFNGVNSFTTSLASVGLYDLKVSFGMTTTIYRGYIMITDTSVGALPKIETLTPEKTDPNVLDAVKIDYTGRYADGKASQGLYIGDPSFFRVRGGLYPATWPTTWAMWIKPESFNHQKYGTNLLVKRVNNVNWAQQNWGHIWTQIRPLDQFKKEDEVANKISMSIISNNFGDNELEQPNPDCMTHYYPAMEGQWMHVAFTFDRTTKVGKIYVNGKKVSEHTFIFYSAEKPLLQTKGNGLNRTDGDWTKVLDEAVGGTYYLGGPSVYKSGFTGVVDELQIWNKALTDAEVLQCMNGYHGATPVPAALVGYYDFETFNADNSIPNKGSAGETWSGNVCIFDGVGGENPTQTEVVVTPTARAGSPFLSGELPITTTASWSSSTNEVSFLNNVNNTALTGMSGNVDAKFLEGGTQPVTLTLENGWGKDTRTIELIVAYNATALDGSIIENLTVYPNPFVEKVAVLFKQAGKYNLNVYSMNGQQIEQKEVSVNDNEMVQMSVNGEKGIYLIQITNEQNKVIQSVKVQKQ